jgi:hypothetical protein
LGQPVPQEQTVKQALLVLKVPKVTQELQAPKAQLD